MAKDGNGAGKGLGHVVSILRTVNRVGCDCPENEWGKLFVNLPCADPLMVAVAKSGHAFPELHMNRKTLLTLAVLTALSAGTAFAVTPAATPAAAAAPAEAKVSRAKLDANGDGFIDRTEAARHPRLAVNFDVLDKNKDGKIGKEEMPPRPERSHKGGDHAGRDGARGEGGRDRLAKLDTNQDGRISRAEATAGDAKFAVRFDEMDVNKDGFIDKADRELRSKQRTDAWFAAADTDKDGKLSRAEFDAAKATQRAERGQHPRQPPAKPAA